MASNTPWQRVPHATHRPSSARCHAFGRNGGYDGYRAALADEKAWARARRPKRCKLANNPRLRQAVASKLRLNWAPEQIAGWLKRAHPSDESCHVSHEFAVCLFKPVGLLRRSCFAIFDRNGRSVGRNRRVLMAMDGDRSRISSRSASERGSGFSMSAFGAAGSTGRRNTLCLEGERRSA